MILTAMYTCFCWWGSGPAPPGGAGGGAAVLRTLTVTRYSPQMEPEETKTRPFL